MPVAYALSSFLLALWQLRIFKKILNVDNEVTLRSLSWFHLKQEEQNGRKHTVKRSSFWWVHCIAQQVPGPYCALTVTMVIHISNKAACLSMPCQDLEITEKVKSHLTTAATKTAKRGLSKVPNKLVQGQWASQLAPQWLGRMKGTRYPYAPSERISEKIIWASSP